MKKTGGSLLVRRGTSSPQPLSLLLSRLLSLDALRR